MPRIIAGFLVLQSRMIVSELCRNERHNSLAAVASLPFAFSCLSRSRCGNSWLLTKNGNIGRSKKSNKRRHRGNMSTLWITHHDEIEETSNNVSADVTLLGKTSSIKSAPAQLETNTGSTAIILNMNARRVTPDLISIASEIFGDSNVFVTETAEDATLAARTVVRGASASVDPLDGGEDTHKYSLVIPVGGDGTLSGWINAMVDEILALQKLETNTNMSVDDAMKQLPLVGYLPMGTGNGLGYVVGCKHDSKADKNEYPTMPFFSRINLFTYRKRRKLQRTRGLMRRLKEVGDVMQHAEKMNPQSDIANILLGICTLVEMPMMEVTHQSSSTDGTEKKGDLCFFAGAGFDSLMLHDFQQIRAWSRSSKRAPTFLKEALSSVAGYCVALITKTLPQTLKYGTHKIQVKVVTSDEGTLWVDHRRGDFSELAVKRNDSTDNSSSHLIYSGTTGIIAASTTPYYGGGLRLFPYARLIPDKLQLRIGRISPLVGFFNIPKIFEGSYREKSEKSFGCLDFIGRDFEVELLSERYEDYVRKRKKVKSCEDDISTNLVSKGFPFQHSGESVGIKDRFQIRLVQEPIKFISFLEPRVIKDG